MSETKVSLSCEVWSYLPGKPGNRFVSAFRCLPEHQFVSLQGAADSLEFRMFIKSSECGNTKA